MTTGTTYSSAATAIRGGKRKGMKDPRAVAHADGRFTVVDGVSPLYDATKRVMSKVKKPVRLVWDLCFDHPKAKRRDIIAMAIEAGVSKNTAATQYQYWRQANAATFKKAGV